MPKINPPAPRARITEDGREMRISIPARRSWPTLLVLPPWLVGWAFGEVIVLRELLSGRVEAPLLPMLVWLTGWTLGGAWAITTLLWTAAGRDVLTIDANAVLLRQEVGSLGYTREFDRAAIRNWRVSLAGTDPWSAWRRPQNIINTGPIAFDYGARTYRFGAGVDEAEAHDIVAAIIRRTSPDDPPPPAR